MWKLPTALAVLSLLAAPAQALELKNPRAIYGPFGPERTNQKFLPGDQVLVTFQILEIQQDPKSGKARFHTVMDLMDGKGGLVFHKENDNEGELNLGGNQLPGYAEFTIGADQAAGNYTLKITVKDLLVKEAGKSFTFPLEVLPADFGFVQVLAPAAGWSGPVPYQANFAITGMGRDAKKMPNVEVRVHVLDEAGKPAHPRPLIMTIPKDLPEEFQSKVDTMPLIPLTFPLWMNRPGRFHIELEGIDNNSKKTTRLRLPLTVLDISNLAGK